MVEHLGDDGVALGLEAEATEVGGDGADGAGEKVVGVLLLADGAGGRRVGGPWSHDETGEASRRLGGEGARGNRPGASSDVSSAGL